jgi:hypothetical protein
LIFVFIFDFIKDIFYKITGKTKNENRKNTEEEEKTKEHENLSSETHRKDLKQE